MTALLFSGLMTVSLRVSNALTWETIPSGTSDHLTGLAQSGDLVIAVGNTSVLKSDDGGATWALQTSPSAAPLHGIARGAGRFVMVGAVDSAQGNQVNIFSSGNGTNWSAHSSGADCTFLSVRYLDGRFIALGTTGDPSNIYAGHGVIATSLDGVTWTVQTSSFPTILLDVAYGNELLVAVGPINVATSTDRGATWQHHPGPTGYVLRGIDFKDGRFLAVRDANPATGEQRLIYQTYDGICVEIRACGNGGSVG